MRQHGLWKFCLTFTDRSNNKVFNYAIHFNIQVLHNAFNFASQQLGTRL